MLSVVFWGRAENSVNEKAGPIQAGPAWGLMEITSEIFQIGGAGYTSPEDAAVYVINFDGHAAMVDAGCGRAWPWLPIKGIASTHGRVRREGSALDM